MLGLTAAIAGPTAISRTSRRAFLRVGAAAPLGLSLAHLLRAAETGRGRARSLIVFALEGGPSHIDLWDMKPEAPEAIRGEFAPIETSAPGLLFCEHLPRLARQAHHLAVVRSVHHTIGDHNAGYYQAVTGKSPSVGGRLIVAPSPENFPCLGSVVARLKPGDGTLPDFVHVPDWMSNNGFLLPGQGAGFLGARFEPFLAGDPSLPGYRVPGLTLSEGMTESRVASRHALLDLVDRTLDGPGADAAAGMGEHYRKAYDLIASPAARRAFDLDAEPASVRERYGLDPDNPRAKEARQFGGLPHLGQCLLLARRLIEAGVRVVTVCTGARFDQTWDTHRQHFPLLKRSILPMFDRGFSALLEDLSARGLLDETLVLAVGEFGRTPRVGQVTSDAGADANGRDHWPYCYSVLLAGGGVPGGSVYGASDRFGAYPARDPVTPADIVATVYQALGIDPATILRDPNQDRPLFLSEGTPIRALL